MFEQVKEDTIYEKCKVRPEFQRPLHQAFPMPEDRMEFWKSYRRKGFYQIAIDYGGLSRKKYWKEQISYCKKKLKNGFKRRCYIIRRPADAGIVKLCGTLL